MVPKAVVGQGTYEADGGVAIGSDAFAPLIVSEMITGIVIAVKIEDDRCFLRELAGCLGAHQPHVNGITCAPLQAKQIADKLRPVVALDEKGRARLETGFDVAGQTPLFGGHREVDIASLVAISSLRLRSISGCGAVLLRKGRGRRGDHGEEQDAEATT